MALRRPEQVRHDADARALQRVRAQQLRIAPRNALDAEGGDGISRVVAGHDVEQQRCVRHRARDRADLVLRQAVRNDAGPADEAAGRADADEIVGGGGRAYRLAGVAAGAQHRKIRGDRRAGAAAGAAGGAAEVIGVAHLAAQARNRHAPARELLQVRLGEDQRPCLAYPRHGESVGGRHRCLHADIAAAGGHVEGIEIVLEDDRDAMQRAGAPGACPVAAVHLGGDLHGFGIDRDDRMQRRALPCRRPRCGRDRGW